MPPDLNKAFRKPENCNFCKNVQTAVKLYNVSPDEFEETYAYKGGPVLVSDATVNWTALEVCIMEMLFNFKKKGLAFMTIFIINFHFRLSTIGISKKSTKKPKIKTKTRIANFFLTNLDLKIYSKASV